jgi:hypothetical protein
MKKISIFLLLYALATPFVWSEEMILKQITPNQRIIIREEKTIWQVLIRFEGEGNIWVDQNQIKNI